MLDRARSGLAARWTRGVCLAVGLWGAAVAATAAQDPADPTAPATNPAQDADLTTRYRFSERYGVPGSRGLTPGSLTHYEVAFRETESVSVQGPDGPVKQDFSRVGRYTECPSDVGPIDYRQVAAVVRRYDAAKVAPDPWAKLEGPSLMYDLTIRLAPSAAGPPAVLLLTPGRLLYEQEYRFAVSNPFTPSYGQILPDEPVRLYDEWTLSRAGVSALLGLDASGGAVTGQLKEIKTDPSGIKRALIAIKGETLVGTGRVEINAELEFLFTPQKGRAARGEDPPIEARGGTSKLRLASKTTAPGSKDGAASRVQNRELIVQRRWPAPGVPLGAPSPLPERTIQNSWLTYVDPQGRFHFRHPQDLQIQGGGPNQVVLAARSFGGGSFQTLLTLGFQPDQSPAADAVFQEAYGLYQERGYEVLPVPARKLPADQWAGAEATVAEARLNPGKVTNLLRDAPRLHYVGYVLKFPQKGGVVASGLSGQDATNTFKVMLESLMKTFRLGNADLNETVGPTPNAEEAPAQATEPAASDSTVPAGDATPAGDTTPADSPAEKP